MNINLAIGRRQSNALRGLALIFVILSHIPKLYSEMNLSIFNPLGYIGVGIFLCLSGYGLQKSFEKYGLKDFGKKRIRRIIPALVVTTLMIVIIAAFNGITFQSYQIVGSCLGFSDSVNPVTWYILMMWFCYIVFYILKKNKVRNLMGGGVFFQLLFF